MLSPSWVSCGGILLGRNRTGLATERCAGARLQWGLHALARGGTSVGRRPLGASWESWGDLQDSIGMEAIANSWVSCSFSWTPSAEDWFETLKWTWTFWIFTWYPTVVPCGRRIHHSRQAHSSCRSQISSRKQVGLLRESSGNPKIRTVSAKQKRGSISCANHGQFEKHMEIPILEPYLSQKRVVWLATKCTQDLLLKPICWSG